MNKKTILKIILSIITIALITCLTTSVFAEDEEEGALDLSGTITGEEDTSGDDDKETTGNEETTTGKETEENKETTTGKETEGNEETTVDTKIPQTGLEDSMPIAILFVACGVVGVYTFIKLSQYSNI